MAARENQGLHIALIVFVMLTIALGVGTYYYFGKFDDAEKKLKVANDANAEAVATNTKNSENINLLRGLIGVSDTEDPAKIVADAKSKFLVNWMALFNSQLPEQDRTYQKVVDHLVSTIQSINGIVANSEARIKQLNEQLTAEQKKAEADKAEIQALLTKAQEALQAEQINYAKNLATIKANEDDQIKARNKADNNFKDARDKNQKDMKALEAVITQLKIENKELKEVLDKNSSVASLATGKILSVNQRDSMVSLNLGQADNLTRGITFSVYPPGTTNIAKAISKGKVEVISITGPHSSDARIVENTIADPLLPGDLVHTLGWLPGQSQRFAFCGFIDLDGSGRLNQGTTLHNLIVQNGGLVDAEPIETKDAEGKLVVSPRGDITVHTRYLIRGSDLTDKFGAPERAALTKKFSDKAHELNVEEISLEKYLEMVGYRPPPGAKAGVAGAEGDKDKDGFRPRQPPGGGRYYKGGF